MTCISLCLVTDKINPCAIEINKSTQFVPLANAYSPTKTLCSIASLISGNRSSKLFRTTSTIINQANGYAKDWLLIRKDAYHVTKGFVFPPNFKMAPVPFSFVVRFSSEVFHRQLFSIFVVCQLPVK